MEMIDRYIYAVTRRLPQKQREDIEKELRSLIEDMINERCIDKEPQKSDIETILNELGDPSKLASKYRDDKNYLIGPELFDTYLFVIKIVMAAVIFGVGLGKTIELFVNPPLNITQGAAELITAIISGAFQGFTWVTVVFAVNERYSFNKRVVFGRNEWSIKDLPRIPKKEEIIKPVDAIFGIIFAVLFIVFFNFASQLLGVYNFKSEKIVSIIPIFSAQGLKNFLPLITVLYCITILKECIKLIIGKWNITSGSAVAVIDLILLIISAVIFTNPSVWNGNFVNELNAAHIAPANMDISMETIWNGVTKGFIYVIAFGFIMDGLVSLIKGIRFSR